MAILPSPLLDPVRLCFLQVLVLPDKCGKQFNNADLFEKSSLHQVYLGLMLLPNITVMPALIFGDSLDTYKKLSRRLIYR